ncbi:MAG: sulfite exporter TauE/SafE family protein [Flavobacteriales bacterium]|nr:sulfite exporter TauE/SafE family protein [Flavobacteriales bacterium]MCB9190411.1 sulfite exporter TauE/SafE family protein [Flavobacteriales bacterium]MCB9204660.1 sulfite exporter TauE/SafE family protein [Flavobacteriales bacterium]
MEYLVIGLVAAFASLLTFFSGFGLGTILTPAFMLFFPIEVAIALTGIVHLLNNLFKMGLVGLKASWEVVLRFGLPAIVGAFIGAQLLLEFSVSEPIFSYQMMGRQFDVFAIKLVVASLMAFFALFEIVPALKRMEFDKNKLIIGGTISGFFGGLSGHQGALRSAFLIRYGLAKETFIATGIVIASFIDITRLGLYFTRMQSINLSENLAILSTAVICAFLGAYFGRKLLKKVTLDFVQWTVAIMILGLSALLAAGVI